MFSTATGRLAEPVGVGEVDIWSWLSFELSIFWKSNKVNFDVVRNSITRSVFMEHLHRFFLDLQVLSVKFDAL